MRGERTSSDPVRSCIGCGVRRPQRELVRLGLGADGEVTVDRPRRLPGRGAYLCGAGCLAAALKRKAFSRAFRGRAGRPEPLLLGQALEGKTDSQG